MIGQIATLISARQPSPSEGHVNGALRYIDLLKLSLIDLLGSSTLRAVVQPGGAVRIEQVPESERGERLVGRDWPAQGTTMIGLARLTNLQFCIETILKDDVPGDVIEAGVWRGGAAIFMRALLDLNGATERLVWAADSFAGLPVPDPATYPADRGDAHHEIGFLAVTLDDVRRNFSRYDIPTTGVRFVEGWFRDTLPALRDNQWSLIRLDGDMYESTMIGLENLYWGVSPGGFVVVDDYGAVAGCKRAVDDFRQQHGIHEELEWIDWTGVMWRKGGASALSSPRRD
jgi:O-methyltransferase